MAIASWRQSAKLRFRSLSALSLRLCALSSCMRRLMAVLGQLPDFCQGRGKGLVKVSFVLCFHIHVDRKLRAAGIVCQGVFFPRTGPFLRSLGVFISFLHDAQVLERHKGI